MLNNFERRFKPMLNAPNNKYIYQQLSGFDV